MSIAITRPRAGRQPHWAVSAFGALCALLFLMLASGAARADFLEDANTIFDWAEQEYPAQLSPPNAPTQARGPWTYRYYADTRTYVGIDDGGNVYFLNGRFGEPVFVDTMDNLLAQIGAGPGGPGAGGCANLPLVAAGTEVSYSLDGKSAGQTVSGSVDTVFLSVTETGATADAVSRITSQGVTTTTESTTEQSYHIAGGNLYVEAIHTVATAKVFGFGATVNTQLTNDPALLMGPAYQFCQDATWFSPSVTQTIESDAAPTTTGASTSHNGTVESVGEVLATPAGTFDTVRVHVAYSDGSESVRWISIADGIMVRQEDYAGGTLIMTTVATALQ